MDLVTPQLDVAVVGSGIAGMSCAWLLSQRHRVTLYEADERPGGHTNTVALATPDGSLGIDTGFIVYNEKTYPNLTALFRHLGVETTPSEMSFAVSMEDGGFEYAGTDLGGLFAQRLNLVRPRFWGMMRDLLRFYRQAPRDVTMMEAEALSLGAYLDQRGYGPAFQRLGDLVDADARDPRLSGGGLRPLLRQSRSAADRQPPGLAHRQRRLASLCESAPGRPLRSSASRAEDYVRQPRGGRRAPHGRDRRGGDA
jgi:phytoene dehydrogenase-like protein